MFQNSPWLPAISKRRTGVDKPDLFRPVAVSYTHLDVYKRQEYAEALSAAATGNGCRVKTHLKIDTGMYRIGFSCDQNGISEAVGACSLPALDMKGIYTHFSCADSAECRETAEQAKRYKKAVNEIERQNGKFEIHHLSNSAAILKYPEYHSDAVRAGIILYGLKPSDFVNDRDNVKPVMEFYSTIVPVSYTHLDVYKRQVL